MALDKAELAKLSPEERIKKLKEFEEENKKDIEEAEDLIKRTEAEIEKSKIPDIEIPAIEPLDISRMFEAGEGLENTVAVEAPLEEEKTVPIKYGGVVEQTGEAGYVPDEHDWVEVDRVAKVEDGIKYESATDKADDLTGSRSVLKHIKKYTRG